MVLLVVIAVIGIAGDRLAARLAADEAERRLVAEGFTGPSVTMHGFPFLTQLAARRFERVTLTADSLDSGEGEARAVSAESRSSRLGRPATWRSVGTMRTRAPRACTRA